MEVNNDRLYRVVISDTTEHVEVMCFGMDSVDPDAEGHYSSVHDLPSWIQTKLSMLMMLDVPPPLNEVLGVGSRIGPSLYWVYK